MSVLKVILSVLYVCSAWKVVTTVGEKREPVTGTSAGLGVALVALTIFAFFN